MKFTIKLLCALSIFGTLRFSYAQTPNIVFIIADDMGWSQTSATATNFNNPSDFYETPIIASLSAEGIAFPNAYVNGANCAPTRAAILSGQWASRSTNNVFAVDKLNRGGSSTLLVGPDQGLSNGQDEIPGSAITIGETMKTAGYTTAHFGKYHSGGSMDNTPEEQGFDFNYGGGSAGNPGSYFASDNSGTWKFSNSIGPELDPYAQPYTEAQSLALAGDNSLTNTKKHVTDAMADAAIDFMNENNTAPFFMHFSNYAIHGPWGEQNARPDLYAKYVAKNNSNPSQVGHDNVAQAAILEGMDQSIGRLIDYLKTTPDPRNPGNMLAANTLVYFVSDNGGANGPEDNIPLKGMKGEYTEGGIRAVTFAWSDGLLANMGTPNLTPVQAFDIYPTFAEMGGATLPSNYDVDGTSMWALLSGSNPDLGREAIFWHFPGYLEDNKRDQRPTSVIRKGAYKLIYYYETASYELFDVDNDLSESTDLLAGSPDVATLTIANDLSTDLRNYLINVNAPLPTYRSNGTSVSLPEIISTENPSATSCVLDTYTALWNFDSMINTNDVSTNNNDALMITGGVTYDTVDFKEGDQAAIFNGTTKIQYSNDSGSFMTNATSAKTIAMWIKPDGLVGIQELFEEGGGTTGIAIRLNGATLETNVRDTRNKVDILSANYPTDGDWHHVALVYDGVNTSQKIFIDGNVVATSNTAPNQVRQHNGEGGIAGVQGKDCFGEESDLFYQGKMDAVAVYEVVLSDEEVLDTACFNTTPPPCTTVTVDSEDFESGLGIWTLGGSDARYDIADASYANSGSYCVRLRDNTDSSVITTGVIDASTYETITVDFSYYCVSMEGTEDFWLQISTDGGNSYNTVEEWNRGDEFFNNERHNDQVQITGPFSSDTRIRFRADASGNSDWVYLDDIVISACANESKSNTTAIETTEPSVLAQTETKSIAIYPAPFTDSFNVTVSGGTYNSASVEVFNLLGKLVVSEDFNIDQEIKVESMNLAKGQYFAKIVIDDQVFVKQLIKK